MNFILWPDDENMHYIIRLRYENGKYLGNTYFGQPIINFTASGNNGKSHSRYDGWTGGRGPTRLNCTAGSCDGIIVAKNTRLTHTYTNGVYELSGVHNFYRVELKRSANKIDIRTTGAGDLFLDKESEGNYEGNAYYYTNDGIRQFRARAEGEGCLKDFNDDPLLMMIIGAPLAVSNDEVAGVKSRFP